MKGSVQTAGKKGGKERRERCQVNEVQGEKPARRKGKGRWGHSQPQSKGREEKGEEANGKDGLGL